MESPQRRLPSRTLRLDAWKEKLQHKAPARAAFDFAKGVSQGTTPGALVRIGDEVLKEHDLERRHIKVPKILLKLEFVV